MYDVLNKVLLLDDIDRHDLHSDLETQLKVMTQAMAKCNGTYKLQA